MRSPRLLKQRLREGKFAFGSWAVLPSSSVANVLAASGFDFVIIDMEHGPASFETAEDMIRAIESEGAAALVRVPSNDPALILRALEIGAHGIVVPQISSADEAKRAVEAIRYFPEGARGFSPYARSAGYFHREPSKLAASANQDVIAILLVEGVDGIANLDAITKVPGVDVIYLGVYDLSQSVGLPGQFDHEKVRSAMTNAIETVRAQGIALGCLSQSADEIARYRKAGVQLLAHMADSALLMGACRDIVAQASNNE
jgi:4-hydroxy-2-oxoheptanedioate aldolase